MNCVVIDDEPLARTGMKLLIEQVPHLDLSAMFSRAVEADEFLRRNPVDVIFLDIQMPGLNGLDFIRSCRPDAQVVITTAYPQFAVEAFDLEVADYLVKPVRFDRFLRAVSRISSRQSVLPASVEEEYIFIRTERKYVRTFYRDIHFIEGLKDYVVVYCGQERHMVATNLKTISDALPSGWFLRISKSHVVNMHQVSAIENDCVVVHGRRLPVGEHFRKMVMDFISQRKVIRRPQ